MDFFELNLAKKLAEKENGGGGGGGSVDIQPKLTITIDNSASDTPVSAIGWELDGNNIKFENQIEISAGDTGTLETLVLGFFDSDVMETFFEINTGDIIVDGGGHVSRVDNLVNCEGDIASVIITDPSQPASCTFVIGGGIN